MSDSRDASLSGVSEADGPGASGAAPEGRGSGSSLADAVAAALANVSTPAPATRAVGAREPDTVRMPVIVDRADPAGDARSAGEPASGEREPGERASDAPGASVVASGSVTIADAPTLTDLPAIADPPASSDGPSADASSADGASSDGSSSDGPSADRPPIGDVPTIPDPPASADPPASRGDDETVPSPTQSPSEPTAASSEGSTTSSGEGEPTVRLGGALVQHLTPESAKEAPEGVVVQYYGRTDVGLVREHNEDNFLVADLSQERRGLGDTPAILKTTLGDRGLVLAVCDGMGGAAAGEVASQMAVDTIYEIMQAGSPPKDRDHLARRLVRAVEEAGSRIFAAAKMDRSRRGMGTTATVAAMMDGTLFVGQVGDSRAYVLRGDQLALVTKDQSLVNQLIEAGQLTEEEAEAFEHSNIILQALGTTEEVTVDLTFLELRQGDRLLMCSDGLSGLVHGDMMREVLKSSRDLSEAAQQLIAMANAGGGHDNITVICAEFDGTTLRPPSSEVRVAYQQYPLPPEDPADADPLPPRPTSMKSGGPKPGADVKLEGIREPRDGAEPGASGRWWALGLVLLFILVCVAAVIVLMDTGEQTSAADAPASAVTIETTRSRSPAIAAPPAAESGTVVVRTEEDGQLYVDGEPHLAAGAPNATLTLPAGSHRLEIRRGDVQVADERVSVEPGARIEVTLAMPTGASDRITADPVPAAPAVTGASGPVLEPSAPSQAAEPAPPPTQAQPGDVR